MKKIICFLFFIFSIFSFSANIDSAKARQDAINEAQKWVDQKTPYVWGVTDCSHLVAAAYGKSGLQLPTGSAANGRYTQSIWNSKTNKILPGQENLLKPGDAVFFYRSGANGVGHTAIVSNINAPECGGDVQVIETYSSNADPRKKCLKDMKGYVGAISFDEIIRVNGHTPVNTDGTIIAPVGSPVGEDTQYYDSGYIVDYDGVIEMFKVVFIAGVKNVRSTIIVIMTFVFLITFTLKCIKSGFSNIEIVLLDLVFDLLKFVFFLVIINNYAAINNTTLKLCFSVAKAFGSDLEDYKVLNQLMTSYIENIEFLLKAFGSESSNVFVKVLQTGMNMINPFKITIIMGCIFYITTIFGYIVFQVTKVIMTFIIGNAITVLLLPFWFSDYLKEYIPNPLTVFCKSVLQMFGSIVFISISLKAIEGVKVSDDTGFDYVLLFTYMIYFTIVAMILRKILRTITQIV